MAAKITREQFLARVGDLARASGKHSADWALTIAAMLAATKVCPSPQGSDPGSSIRAMNSPKESGSRCCR